LVELDCGHNGKFSHEAESLLTLHLDYAGFITSNQGKFFSARRIFPKKSVAESCVSPADYHMNGVDISERLNTQTQSVMDSMVDFEIDMLDDVREIGA